MIRADASPQIGSGHVRRCLALVTALASEGWRCAFAVRTQTHATVPELLSEGWPVLELSCEPADEPRALATRWPQGVDLLVADHYGRDSSFESACRGWAKRVLAIDDLGDRHHDADLLLDQSLGRNPEAYANLVPSGCRILVGATHALLRPQFAKLRLAGRRGRRHGTLSRVVVSLGAVDPDNLTGTIVSGLAASGLRHDVDVMIGGTAPHLAELRELCRKGGPMFNLHVDCDDPAELLAVADLAIGAGGTSAWERCCLALPTLLVLVAENQRANNAALVAAGAAQRIAESDQLSASNVADAVRSIAADPVRLVALAHAAGILCDGLGARRVALEIDPPQARDGHRVLVRAARDDDGDIMLAWQSQPGARRFSNDTRPPVREAHFAWLADKLADPHCMIGIIEHAGRPSGVLRLDRRGEGPGFIVSILVDAERQRLGLARAALEYARRLLPDRILWAEVLPGNEVSAALFRSAGYRNASGNWLTSDPTDALMQSRAAH